MASKKNTPAAAALTVRLAVSSANGVVDQGMTNISHLYREVPSAFYQAYREALREAVADLGPEDTHLIVTYTLPTIEVAK